MRCAFARCHGWPCRANLVARSACSARSSAAGIDQERCHGARVDHHLGHPHATCGSRRAGGFDPGAQRCQLSGRLSQPFGRSVSPRCRRRRRPRRHGCVHVESCGNEQLDHRPVATERIRRRPCCRRRDVCSGYRFRRYAEFGNARAGRSGGDRLGNSRADLRSATQHRCHSSGVFVDSRSSEHCIVG